jgi:hypothetical protein
MFWFTLSIDISMKFAVISCRISLSGCSCGLHWVPWDSLPLFCWSLELGIHFIYFPLNPVLIHFCRENVFHPFFVFPLNSFGAVTVLEHPVLVLVLKQ